MQKRRFVSAALFLCAPMLFVVFDARAANLTLTESGRVAIELISSSAAFRNTLAVGSPNIAIPELGSGNNGCATEPADGLTGVHILSEKIAQRGCRVELDADPSTETVEPFTAGTTIEFRLCAQTDADPACEFIWSSDPSQNSDNFDHLRTTPIHSSESLGQSFQLAWEDLENGGDLDFNDLIVVLRVTLDSDGDGLWDDWEQLGVDTTGDGERDLDLRELGADPLYKDIFVEIDYMDCAVAGGDCDVGDTHSHEPHPAAVAAVVKAFADAPVCNPAEANPSNPCGRKGINLHVDVDNAIAHQNLLTIPGELCVGSDSGIGSFDTVKADPANYGPTNPRRFAYHYALFAHRQSASSTPSGCAELPGNDLLVSLGGWNEDIGSVQEQADTLMHELGHNLGLDHGGGDGVNRKPNYISIMNWAFQNVYGGGIPPNDPDGPGPLRGRVDYSGEKLDDLHESSLNEPAGIGNGSDKTRYHCRDGSVRLGDGIGPIDWNCNRVYETYVISGDINFDDELEPLFGFNDWESLKYDFQGAGDYADGQHSFSTRVVEIDYATASPPVADAGAVPDGNPNTPPGPPFELYQCLLGGQINLDGSGSSDRNGTIVSFNWDYLGAGGTSLDALGPSPSFDCSFNVGPVNVFLTTTDDDGLKTTDQGTIDILVDAGPDQTVECAGQAGTSVTLGSSLPTNSSLTYEWKSESGDVVGITPEVTLMAPLGTSTFSLTVTDQRGVTLGDSVSITVEDTENPAIQSLKAVPEVLWPPNHKMVPISMDVSIADICDPSPVCRISSVSSSEPENAQGDGHTTPDWEVTGNLTVNLRAERSGAGSGRKYTIGVECSDHSANRADASAYVRVPHDKRHGRKK